MENIAFIVTCKGTEPWHLWPDVGVVAKIVGRILGFDLFRSRSSFAMRGGIGFTVLQKI